jgi:phosphatidylinositol-3-phosphatase
VDINAIVAALVAFLLALLGLGPAPHTTGVPHLSHVFVIVEENTNFSDVFGAKAGEAPFLNGLANAHVRHDAYYAISHVSLGNYIGMVSGQQPSALDHVDCPTYVGCVRSGPTITDQLDGAGLSWRAYMGGMPAPCTHPTTPPDQYQNGYATRHNPFMYFSEIVNDPYYCANHDVPYEGNFASDLAAGGRNFSFIVPDTCDDGHDSGCAAGTPIQHMDGWLSVNVPPILSYIDAHPDSALFITFDEAANTDTAGCCNQPPLGLGGGHVGLVMYAPGHEHGAGYHVTTPGNHYSLLRTIEASFNLGPLGAASKVDVMNDLFAP